MDIKDIKELAELMKNTGLTHLNYTKKDEHLVLERQQHIHFSGSEFNEAASIGIIGGADGPTSVLARSAEEQSETEAPAVSAAEGTAVVSPTVGVFYAAPSPESDPFVQIGDTVKKGDVLCIIEAMKLMNEITAEIDGVVTEICVGNGQVVEYDQPLFRIK